MRTHAYVDLFLIGRDARAAFIQRLRNCVGIVAQTGDYAQTCDNYSFTHRTKKTPLI